MVGHVEETVFLLDAADEALGPVEFAFQDGRPGRIAQVAAPAVGEFHEVLVVLVASAGQHRVQAVEVELAEDTLEQILRHTRVVEHAQGFAALAALHAFRDFLEHARAQVVVYLHLGIAGKLEGVGLISRVAQSFEDEGQAVAHGVVQIHQVALPLVVRQAHEASALGDGQFQEGIVRHRLRFVARHLHGQVDVLVVLIVEHLDGREPHRHDEAAQLRVVVVMDEVLLLRRKLRIRDEEDVLPPQRLGHFVDGLRIGLGILGVQLVDLLDDLLGMFALACGRAVRTFRDAALAGHAHTEKLIQIVRINAQERHALQQGHMLAGRFL